MKMSEEILSKEKNETRLTAQNPYGTGHSSETIENLIKVYFNNI